MAIAHNKTKKDLELIESARKMIPALRARSAQAERDMKIPDETIAEMQAAGLFKAVLKLIRGPFLKFSEHWLKAVCLLHGFMA